MVKDIIPSKLSDAADTSTRHYFRNAAELRLAIQFNIDDAEFARAGGRLAYVVDANVIRLFLNPIRETHHVDMFREDKKHPYLKTTAVITAEWLFSKELAGQKGSPALITPAHAIELGEWIDDLKRQLVERAEPNSGNAISILPMVAKRILNALTDGHETSGTGRRLSAEKARRLVHRIVARNVADSPLAEAEQYIRLHRQELLRPLVRDRYASSDILRLPESEIKSWSERIGAQRASLQRQVEAGTGNDTLGDAKRRDRIDAEAILQVMKLNERVCRNEPPIRYLFITTDRAIYRAYSMWLFDQSKPTDIGSTFILRHPWQYVPLLNVTEMPTAVLNSDFIYRARETLDGLFSFYLREHPQYPYVLSGFVSHFYNVFDRSSSDASFFNSWWQAKLWEELFGSSNASKLNAIVADWRKASSEVVGLNLDLLRRRVPLLTDAERQSTYGQERLGINVMQRLSTVLTDVDAAHIAFNMHEVLGFARRVRESQHEPDTIGGSDSVPLTRMPLAVRTNFGELTGSIDINEFLDRIVSEGQSISILNDLERRLRAGESWHALFFVVCIANRLGLWRAAVHYGTLAVRMNEQKLETDSGRCFDKFELLYVMAVTLRLSGEDEAAFNRARDIIASGIKHYVTENDTFGRARAYSEHASLILHAVYSRLLLVNYEWVTRDMTLLRVLGEATTALREAAALLRGDGGLLASDDQLVLIRLQINANILSAYLALLVLGSDQESFSAEEILLALATVESGGRQFPKYVPPVCLVEYRVAVLMFCSLRSSDMEAICREAQEIRELCERLLSLRDGLTRLDRSELEMWPNMVDDVVRRKLQN